MKTKMTTAIEGPLILQMFAISTQTDKMNANEEWKQCVAICTNQLHSLEKTLDKEKKSYLVS